MRMNKSEMRGEFKELMKMAVTSPSVDKGAPKNARIDKLNEFQRDSFFSEIVINYGDVLHAPQTLSYAANSEFIMLDRSMALRVVRSMKGCSENTVNTFQSEMRPMKQREFVNYSTLGAPEGFCVVGERLYLRPIPVVNWNVTITLARSLVILTDDEFPNELPDEFHQLIPLGASLRYKRETGDPTAKDLMLTFEDEKSRLMQWMESVTASQRGIGQTEPQETSYDY